MSRAQGCKVRPDRASFRLLASAGAMSIIGRMSTGPQSQLKFEIGHVLFLDIVGYSRLLITEQSDLLEKLTVAVARTKAFRQAEAEGKLIRLPTGDGMALVFRNSPEAPLQCAVELGQAFRAHPELGVRMGIHSGPINEVIDVNGQTNITGAGINLAQRVMDCADAGHILLSKRVADDLEQYPEWRDGLQPLGQVEVKHGVRLDIVSFYNEKVGNAAVPEKLKQARAADRRAANRRWLAAGAIALALVFTLAAWFSLRRTPIPHVIDRSIAVLPLENLSLEKENAYFAAGIQDELLSNLGKIKDLKVISRTSVMQYKAGIARNLKEIAQQLGVSNVVEGSVRRSGDHLRVTVQLIDALTDRHIWSENYDRTMTDSLALEGELAIEIADAIGATLTPQEKARVEAIPTKNTAAYDAYLRGRAAETTFTADPDTSARSFRDAVTLDPGFALAWAHLSAAESMVYWRGNDHSAARLAAAKAAMDRATTLNPALPENHLAVGYYRYYGLRDFAGALAEFQAAVQVLPNNVDALQAIGLIYRRLGHWEDAAAFLRRASELDPRDTLVAGMLGTTYMATRNFSEVVAVADRILAIEPSNNKALGLKLDALLAQGRADETYSLVSRPDVKMQLRAYQAVATHHFDRAIEFQSQAVKGASDDEKGEALLYLALAHQFAGNAAQSKVVFAQAVGAILSALRDTPADSATAAQFHSNLGLAYAGLGQAARAVEEGQKGMSIQSTADDPFEGPMREEDMAVIYAVLGDADNAIPILQRWCRVASGTGITPGLLRIDPTWDPIRNDPRFQELIAEKKR